jgi:hypothetical protein
MTPAPPMPPEIAQQASPEGQQGVFEANGIGHEQPEAAKIQQVLMALQKLEGPMDEANSLLGNVKPALQSYLQIAAEAFIRLRKNLTELVKRSGAAQGSPEMPNTPQGNPASGPPNPSQYAGIQQ